jgi:hypothetical protein
MLIAWSDRAVNALKRMEEKGALWNLSENKQSSQVQGVLF